MRFEQNAPLPPILHLAQFHPLEEALAEISGLDRVAREQPARVARVLAEDDVGVGESAEHAQRDILEVPDRGRADVEHGGRPA